MANNAHRFTNPETIHTPVGYTHVVETRGNRTVYISGQVALDQQGTLVGLNDMGAQAEQVFQNLKAALSTANASFSDVVKLTYFIVDISQMQVIRDVRNRYLNGAQPPASTAVEVRGLVRKEFLLEVEAIAVLND